MPPIHALTGVKLRGGLDLTVAVPPNRADRQRGRNKLGLFDIFRTFFSAADHVAKDETIDHSKWRSSCLDDQQVRSHVGLIVFREQEPAACVRG